MQVEQIDRDAGADFMGSIPAFYGQEHPMRDGLHDTSLIVQAFARHRRQVRAEVVGEIVAWLQDGFMRDFDQLWRDQLINEIEAKFGGRDER